MNQFLDGWMDEWIDRWMGWKRWSKIVGLINNLPVGITV